MTNNFLYIYEDLESWDLYNWEKIRSGPLHNQPTIEEVIDILSSRWFGGTMKLRTITYRFSASFKSAIKTAIIL